MAPLMPHESIKGKFMVVAKLVGVPGKGDELQEAFKELAAYCNSDKEPGTLLYRAARGVGEEDHQFTVMEEYNNRDALNHHRTSEPYLALGKRGLVQSNQVSFYEEV